MPFTGILPWHIDVSVVRGRDCLLQMPTAVMLPNEILVAIFAHLDTPTWALLARVSCRFNAVAEYLLYSSIAITDVISERDHLPQRTICWSQAMLSRPHLAGSVKRLQIRWTTESQQPPSLLLLSVCDRLSLAIRILISLEHLDLSLGPANFVPVPHENMHAIERATYSCALPALRFCSLGADYAKGIQPYTTHITSFLSHTPSLRHLSLFDHHSFLSVPPAPHALPALQVFCGSAATAASLLPGRPVHYLSLFGRDSDVSQENLLSMARTTTPLRFLDISAISARPVLLRNISAYLPTLEHLRIRLALRHTLHYALSGISILAGLSPVLGAFPNLAYLDLSPTIVGGRGNPEDERVLCREYSRTCPLLRTIIFPPQTEWVCEDHLQWRAVES